ncbi:hypothetical protein NDU88_006379 [Pleurodeles waltl]|uniref:Uncharacterized protein n=1 Tax=Pleurodeles waltl TaxID=8319 RepID=A0AAV7RRW6_PLEWA|nr:hypothetical protein NDU88_006379 [Pleurodeles waltl]
MRQPPPYLPPPCFASFQGLCCLQSSPGTTTPHWAQGERQQPLLSDRPTELAPLFTDTDPVLSFAGRGRADATTASHWSRPLSPAGWGRVLAVARAQVPSGGLRRCQPSLGPTRLSLGLKAGSGTSRQASRCCTTRPSGPGEGRGWSHGPGFSSLSRPDGLSHHRRCPRPLGGTQALHPQVPKLSWACRVSGRPTSPRPSGRPPFCVCLPPGSRHHSDPRTKENLIMAFVRLTAFPASGQSRPYQFCGALCRVNGGG